MCKKNWLFSFFHLNCSNFDNLFFALRRYNARDIQVLVGTNDLESGGQRYNVEKIKIHENYDQSNFANDIAVFKVRGVIKFNMKAKPIQYSATEVPAGTNAQLTGWGITSVSCYINSIYLKIDLKLLFGLVSQRQCATTFASDQFDSDFIE